MTAPHRSEQRNDGRAWHALATTGGVSAVTTALTFGFTLLAARLLGPDDYGGVAFYLSVGTLVLTLADLGVSVRVVTRFDTSRQAWVDPPLTAFWSAQVYSYAIGAVVITAVAASLFDTSFGAAFLTVVITGISLGILTFASAVFQAMQDWLVRAAIVLAGTVLRVGVAVAVLAGTRSPALTVGAYAVGAAAGVVVAVLLLRRRPASAELPSVPSWPEAIRTWWDSRWFAVAGGVGALWQFGPMAFTNLGGDRADQAVFGVAQTLGTGGAAVIVSVGMTTLLPHACDRRLGYRAYAHVYLRHVVPLLAALVVLAAAVPVALPWLFGDDYASAVTPTVVLMVAAAVLLVANPVQFLHYRRDRQRFLTAVDAVQLVAFAVAVVVLHRTTTWPIPTIAAAGVLASVVLSRAVGVGRLVAERPGRW
jgi:O-antigen/teichoic acid export membrane protein